MKEEIKKHLVEGSVVVIDHISSGFCGTREETATYENVDRLGMQLRNKNGCFISLDAFDENLERKHCAESNEWLTFHTWRIVKVFAPTQGLTPGDTAATQEPVWVNTNDNPMELDKF